MRCAECSVIFGAAKCPVCGRVPISSPGVPGSEEFHPAGETLDALLMDVEQRGLLIITVFRDGSRRVHLLPSYPSRASN